MIKTEPGKTVFGNSRRLFFSRNDETQKFGRDLLRTYFEEENGAKYLLKPSEHPSRNMQLFATNCLENYATGSIEKFEKFAPYFARVLSLVNRPRPAEDVVLKFMETEVLKNEKSPRFTSKPKTAEPIKETSEPQKREDKPRRQIR